MKNLFTKVTKWAQKNWLAIVIFISCNMFFFLCLVMYSWLYAFWSNGLYGTKFDLGSCWQGISVVVAGLGGVVALAKACWTKYSIDSKYNSTSGQKPYAESEAVKK